MLQKPEISLEKRRLFAMVKDLDGVKKKEALLNDVHYGLFPAGSETRQFERRTLDIAELRKERVQSAEALPPVIPTYIELPPRKYYNVPDYKFDNSVADEASQASMKPVNRPKVWNEVLFNALFNLTNEELEHMTMGDLTAHYYGKSYIVKTEVK